MDIGVLWDRLAGGLQEYVENYCLYKNQSKIKPSYDVDYEIECLDELQKHTSVDDYWVLQIAGCEHINNLPIYLQKLVIQYLPRFFKDYPEYKYVDCLFLNPTYEDIVNNLNLSMLLSDQAMNVIKRLPKQEPYICDDRQSIDWETFRDMTDEQFEQHIESLRNKEKTAKTAYCKAVVKLIDYYGFEYIKDKIKESFYAVEENGNRYRYYFCFEGNKHMKTFKARYREWAAYAIIDVDKETYETTIVEYQLP